jgi:hypothetical protein
MHDPSCNNVILIRKSNLLGELERTFLVLREVVALRRQAARDNPPDGNPPQDGELPNEVPPEAPNRGQKRTTDDANDDVSDPKRAHV